MQPKHQSLFSTIFWAGLLVGTLDILAAVIQTLIHGGNPMNMLRFIASGAFGASAFEGGTSTALWGLFFHYVIAFCWTILFFLIYPTIKAYLKNPMVIAICYGAFVWLIMNFLVLPISQTQAIPFNIGNAHSNRNTYCCNRASVVVDCEKSFSPEKNNQRLNL